MSRDPWRRFADCLPGADDANACQCVMAVDKSRRCRAVLFNWVMYAHLWEANGFVAWAPLAHDSPAKPADPLHPDTGLPLQGIAP